MKRFNTAYFIERSKEKHGDKYDYSKSLYITANKKVIIICPKHGEFRQTPNGHLDGRGCEFCQKDRWSKQQEEFLKENYLEKGAVFCATTLNKSIRSIWNRSAKLKLLNKPEPVYKDLFKTTNIPYFLWKSLNRHARSRNIAVDITPYDIYNQYLKQNKKCALSGKDIYFNINNKLNTCSVDRIDSLKNYTIDNIQIIDKTLNFMKSNFSMQEFFNYCKSVYFNLKNTYDTQT